MIYLIYGAEQFLIDEQLKKITANDNELNINNYDLDINSIEEIIDDAETLSLFASSKVIIVKNSNIFTSKKNIISHNTELLENYLNNPNPSTKLIFIVETDKLDSRKKINKIIKKCGNIIECQPPTNLNKFVIDLLGDYNIDTNLTKLLIERVGNNLSILNQEIIKLKLYKQEDKNITKKDILNVTSKNIQPDLFLFIETLINKDIDKALSLYKELLIFNEEPIKIILMLANQFRIMYQSITLTQKGYTQKNIAELLDIHPYRVKLAIEKGWQYHPDDLLIYLEKLADLDYQIKSGKIDKEIGLELFILNL